jgi:non-lysosomal glucosylceramidase
MTEEKRETWPVLTEYDQEHLSRIALPLGGIGTGTVSLGGRGDLRDWEIVNRPAKGFSPKYSFFSIYVEDTENSPVVRALEGVLEPHDYEGAMGSQIPNHSLPRFRTASFQAAYPFGQVQLSDPDVPVDVTIEGFNPFVGADLDVSSIPVAILRFVVTNKCNKTLKFSICGNLKNFIGRDGGDGLPKKNINTFKTSDSVQGLTLSSRGVNKNAEGYGTLALSTNAMKGVSYRTGWGNRVREKDRLLHFWDDFITDGILENPPESEVDDPHASLCVNKELAPNDSETIVFFITWHFPNRLNLSSETSEGDNCCSGDLERIGNYYTTQYKDAWDVAEKTATSLNDYEARTVEFVKTFCESDLPQVVKEAALYNLSTLRTQTCFRTKDGLFYGWEGCNDDKGCCTGSCTHVWNYEQGTAFLFGELACKMRQIEFIHATNDKGHMSFRVNLPLSHALDWGLAAADGQMGCIIKLYRDWQLSGDNELLRRLWPKARKALEFCWVPGGWDADKDGVMEGCQHNTMDVEYYGPNPQMGIWYLGALRAAEEMANYLGEEDFASICHGLFRDGRTWLDKNLYNGEYYEHEIYPPKRGDTIAKGLCAHPTAGSRLQDGEVTASPEEEELEHQLGAGCLVDQLVGQFFAHVCDLGYLVEEKNVKTTLNSILNYNFKENFYNHFNNNRSYVLNDESGLLMATFPRGRRPLNPFPYFSEVMTGFEYTAAIGMLYEGMTEEGLKCIKATRDRYDGKKRNPFDEAECGHHYARAMASWAAVLALTGFHYSGVDKSMIFAAKDGVHFWSNGYAWGTCEQRFENSAVDVGLTVKHGELILNRFALKEYGEVTFDTPQTIQKKESVSWSIEKE